MTDILQQVNSPLAKLNSRGQLICILCNAPVKSAKVITLAIDIFYKTNETFMFLSVIICIYKDYCCEFYMALCRIITLIRLFYTFPLKIRIFYVKYSNSRSGLRT